MLWSESVLCWMKIALLSSSYWLAFVLGITNWHTYGTSKRNNNSSTSICSINMMKENWKILYWFTHSYHAVIWYSLMLIISSVFHQFFSILWCTWRWKNKIKMETFPWWDFNYIVDDISLHFMKWKTVKWVNGRGELRSLAVYCHFTESNYCVINFPLTIFVHFSVAQRNDIDDNDHHDESLRHEK
jgi:hypothetical protein